MPKEAQNSRIYSDGHIQRHGFPKMSNEITFSDHTIMLFPHPLTLDRKPAKHRKSYLIPPTLNRLLAMLFSWLNHMVPDSNHAILASLNVRRLPGSQDVSSLDYFAIDPHVFSCFNVVAGKWGVCFRDMLFVFVFLDESQDVTCLNYFAHLQIQKSPLRIPLDCAACDQSLLTAPPPAPQADGGCGLDHPNWADLPSELLVLVIGRILPLASYIRMAAACQSWHAFLRPCLALQKKPYLLLFSERQPEMNYWLDVSSNNNVKHPIPPLPDMRGKWCVGSQRGCLALIDEASNPILVNPLTGSCLHLPKLTTLPELTPIYHPQHPSSTLLTYQVRFTLSSQSCLLTPEQFRPIGIRKVVFSRDFASALAIYGRDKILICLRPGDDKWTMIDTNPFFGDMMPVCDIICHGGTGGGYEFLVVFADGSVFSLDVTGPSIRETPFAERLGHLRSSMDRFLVEMPSGHILQVAAEHASSSCYHRKMGFNVWRLDASSSSWTQLADLGEYSLFLGSCYTFPVLTTGDNTCGLRPNCIYFTDVSHRLTTLYVHDSTKYNPPRDMGIYSMEDASITTIHLPHQDFAWPLPVWIIPFGS